MEEQQQQQQQSQQAESQQKEKVDNAKIMGQFAKAKLDMAKEQEAYAKIHELNASAEHKEIEADLNLVKLAMELEDVQFNQLKEAFDLAQVMKLANQPQEQTANIG
jgi:hypothetical protein